MNTNKPKILFICRKYFDYEKYIISELESLGFDVTYWRDVPYNNIIYKILSRFNFVFTKITNRIYYNNKINSDDIVYNYIFVIIGESLDELIIKNMRKKYNSSKFIYYIWDSISNRRSSSLTLKKYFDISISFSKSDSEKFDFKYLPLFVIDNYFYTPHLSSLKYDLGFVGTAHSDRVRVIKKIINNNPNLIFRYHLYIHSYFLLILYKIFNPNYWFCSKIVFTTEKIDQRSINKFYNQCKAILDIQHKNQKGLTIRTFEVLFSGKMLVTTNKDIDTLPDISNDQIRLIDRDNPNLNLIFQKNDYFFNVSDLREKYSLRNWLTTILSL